MRDEAHFPVEEKPDPYYQYVALAYNIYLRYTHSKVSFFNAVVFHSQIRASK
jgi:hypothetical protein